MEDRLEILSWGITDENKGLEGKNATERDNTPYQLLCPTIASGDLTDLNPVV